MLAESDVVVFGAQVLALEQPFMPEACMASWVHHVDRNSVCGFFAPRRSDDDLFKG